MIFFKLILYNLIMRKLFLTVILALILLLSGNIIFAENGTVLSGGISLSESVPTELMGSWRIVSKLEYTDSPENFKPFGVDIWNLSKTNNVISLCNPYTGAAADIRVDFVENKTIKFTKEGKYDNRILTDTVEITLNGDKFTGKNYLSLKTYSTKDNSLKTEKTATYTLRGDKISGTSIIER